MPGGRSRRTAEAAKAALLELVSEQEERLEALLAEHLERESAADPDALGFQDTPEGERLRRYQMACDRALLRILEALRKRHREADQAKGGEKRARKGSGPAAGIASPTEADLLRETGARESEAVPPPTISDGRTPASSVTAVPPTVFTDQGPGTTDHSPQRYPDPAPSPTAGLPIHQDATNEANAPPLIGSESPVPSPTEGFPPLFTDHGPRTTDHSSQANEATDSARSGASQPAAALARFALLLFIGLATTLATSAAGVGPDSATRRHANSRRAQIHASKGVESIVVGHTRPDEDRSTRLVSVSPHPASGGSLLPAESPPDPRSLR